MAKWWKAAGVAALGGALGAVSTGEPLDLHKSGQQMVGGAVFGLLAFLINPNKQTTTQTTVVGATTHVDTVTTEKKVE